jgi:hypothetical protein
LAAVYRGFTGKPDAQVSPLFHYYLAIYEELWGLPPGALTSAERATAMEAQYPGYRADARMFVQTFYALPEVHLQFVYFCSRVIRYLDPAQDAAASRLPLASDVPDPDADDYAGAMAGSSAIDRALEEAAERGWVDEATAKSAGDAQENGALSALNQIASRRPGKDVREFTEAVVGHVYKRLVERHLIRLPEVAAPQPDPFLPTTATEWELGDSLRSIDWTLSVFSQGQLAALRPLRRELEPEAPSPDLGRGPAVEIYLDTSGSMPNPTTAVNAMTLAAQIVSAAALRKSGMVKGIIYSSQFEESEWLYNEELARRFLLRYSGGGTQFPFERLVQLSQARAEVVRVLISDSDFLWNVAAKGAPEQFAAGLDRTQMFVALLSLYGDPQPQLKKAMGELMNHPRLRIGVVSNPSELPQAAAQLTRALWGK